MSFIELYQHIPSHISPYIFDAGFFRLHWYGFMYVVAFTVATLLMFYRIKHEAFKYTKEQVFDFLVWVVLGIVLGGRFGYVVFYEPLYYIAHPLQIFSPFGYIGGQLQLVGIAGMSYHGGLIGAIIASVLFAKKRKIDMWKLIRFVMPTVPLGYMFGRIGNFINGELYGRATERVFGMYFPSDPSGLLRHPSQIYEAILEGLVLFVILWILRKNKFFKGFFLGVYIAGYGIARFVIEFVRVPDVHLGTVLGPFTMGQVLSSVMIVGALVFLWVMRKHEV